MRRLISVLCCVAMLLGCIERSSETKPTADTDQDGGNTVHVLTWSNYDGRSNRYDQAQYFFDGKPCGAGSKGIAALKKLALKSGNIVRIRVPWEPGPSSPEFYRPYEDTDLIEHWHRSGIVIEIDEKWPEEDERRVYRLEPSSSVWVPGDLERAGNSDTADEGGRRTEK